MQQIYIAYSDNKTDLQLFCRESVERHQPGWEIVEILSPIRAEDWPISGQYFGHNPREIVRSDLARLEAVWNTGGIYIDSDVYLLQPIDCLLDTSNPTFWNANPRKEVKMTWLNAVFAAPAKNSLIEQLIHASGTGIEKYDINIPTACLDGFREFITKLDNDGVDFNRVGIDDIVFSDFIENFKLNSYQEIVDCIVGEKEKLPLAIHLTQHSWL